MSTFVTAMPPWWQRVVGPPLEAAGHTLVESTGGWGLHPAVLEAATIDLRKGLACVTETPLRQELTRLCDGLGNPLTQALAVYSNARSAVGALPSVEQACTVLLTTCTYDPPGRALAAAARDVGRPLVHLAHACQAGPPASCWYAGELPGDWLLVPGDRDAAWWRACCQAQATCPQVLVTGHPLWDWYAQQTWCPQTPPVLMWLAESGANPAMQRGAWCSRDVPQRAWTAFLAALVQLADWDWQLCLKTRRGEDEALVAHWLHEARERLPGREVVQTDAWLPEVLPAATVVIGQDSNGLVEAAHLGIPSVCVTRRGNELFAPADPVLVLDGEQPLDVLATLLAAGLADVLRRVPKDRRQPEALRAMAQRYNCGAADGQSLARVVAALEQIATVGAEALVPQWSGAEEEAG